MRPQELLWTVVFLLFDRGADERRPGVLVAALVVGLGIVAMALLVVPVRREWTR